MTEQKDIDSMWKNLCIEITLWGERYRQKHYEGKSDADLIRTGYRRHLDGTWYSDKMIRARERKFRKKMEVIGLYRLRELFPRLDRLISNEL
jgi:hypothetical protein